MKRLRPTDQLTMNGPATYRIVVTGELNPDLAEQLAGMSISWKPDDRGEIESVLVGRLPDQAALSGVLNALYDLHFPVVSADCLESG